MHMPSLQPDFASKPRAGQQRTFLATICPQEGLDPLNQVLASRRACTCLHVSARV